MEYNPVHRVMIWGGGNIVTVDPVSGDYLVFGSDGSFYAYDVNADRWTLRPGPVPFASPTRPCGARLRGGGGVRRHGPGIPSRPLSRGAQKGEASHAIG
jgi:hypothetical protein